MPEASDPGAAGRSGGAPRLAEPGLGSSTGRRFIAVLALVAVAFIGWSMRDQSPFSSPEAIPPEEHIPPPPPKTLGTPPPPPPKTTQLGPPPKVAKPVMPFPTNANPGDPHDGPFGIRFRWIPPGDFKMGSPLDEPGRFDERELLHDVTLTRGFWMGETEVTQGQWQELMGNNPSRFKYCGLDCPVERVSWWDALAFANRLSEEADLPACYELDCMGTPGTRDYVCTTAKLLKDCQGFRLPTEAEWERAARAGSQEARYSPDLGTIAWYRDNSQSKTHPVGGKELNGWQLFDMLGNVYEWCGDGYATYLAGPLVDPFVDDGSSRVYRGGSWFSYARNVRAAYRNTLDPLYRWSDLGFRLALGQAAPSSSK